MCQRCEDLEEEVAYLKSELGQSKDADAEGNLRAYMRSVLPRSHGKGGARLLWALYGVRGRVLTRYQILDAIPATRTNDERDPKIADVWVCSARKAMGHDAIENVWGNGYRITPAGMERVAAIVAGQACPPAIPDVQDLSERSPSELRTMAALIAGLIAHKDGDGGKQTAATFRRIADRLTGQPRLAA